MAQFADLIEGYRRFRVDHWDEERERWEGLAVGQRPRVMVIACSDSRVDPAQIFDARPGEMFVVRNVANLVPPFQPDNNYHGVSAALEFAVTQLEVEELVVMGHGFCGGCAAALTGQFDRAAHGSGHFIAHWVDMLNDARADIRARHPELDRAAFREMEMAVAENALAGPPGVLAPGGGWLVQPGHYEKAREVNPFIIYLKVLPSVAAARAGGDGTRPLLVGDDPIARMRALTSEREPVYLQADATIMNDSPKTAEQTAAEVVTLARGQAGWV